MASSLDGGKASVNQFVEASGSCDPKGDGERYASGHARLSEYVRQQMVCDAFDGFALSRWAAADCWRATSKVSRWILYI